MTKAAIVSLTVALVLSPASRSQPVTEKHRPRARDLGLVVGVMPPGKQNAITDVDGVRVGQTTLIQGENVRTGVTAILPHDGNAFQEKVPGAVFVGNGFGKLMGSTQVQELGALGEAWPREVPLSGAPLLEREGGTGSNAMVGHGACSSGGVCRVLGKKLARLGARWGVGWATARGQMSSLSRLWTKACVESKVSCPRWPRPPAGSG